MYTDFVYVNEDYTVAHVEAVCPSCHTVHFIFINRYGKTLCVACDTEMVRLHEQVLKGKSTSI